MWDAKTYDRVADPQEAWAREIIARSGITASDHVLDAGCGSGRVTELLLALTPDVVGVDADAAMVDLARQRLGERVRVEHQSLLDLSLTESFDVIFSCAVFHWITDHQRLFERLHAHLKPGGRLVAQCGGHGNIARVLEVVGERPGTWLYATPEDTERRLRDAGFTQIKTWLEPKPTVPSDMVAFVETVILHGMPTEEARPLAEKAAAELDSLAYVRLNLDATA